MDMEKSNGIMDAYIKESGSMIVFKGKDNIYGKMEGLIKELGIKILCMDLVFTHGLMAENMKGNS